MTLFFICAALLVLLSIGWILLGVFHKTGELTDQEAVNITLARERASTLEQALADGAIDQASYDYEREQLEYDLAADLRLVESTKTRSGGRFSAALLVCAFVPIAAGALYLQLGNPGAIDQSSAAARVAGSSEDATGDTNAQRIAEILPQMEERLRQQPDDIEGWRLLGRSYLSVLDFQRARSAFEKAVALDENDVSTLAQYAEAIAMTQEGELSGEPTELIERALALDPNNEHSIWLMAIAQQQLGNHQDALQGFDRLIEMAGGNREALATVEQMRVRSLAALSGNSNSEPARTIIDEQTTEPAADASGVSVSVTVNLTEEARAASSGEQVVFVYATATQGPPIPLAATRLTVADLPATVTLDDSKAMIPNMNISAFESVTIGARVSSSGNAIAQSGDWFNEAHDIAPESVDELTLTIDQQTP